MMNKKWLLLVFFLLAIQMSLVMCKDEEKADKAKDDDEGDADDLACNGKEIKYKFDLNIKDDQVDLKSGAKAGSCKTRASIKASCKGSCVIDAKYEDKDKGAQLKNSVKLSLKSVQEVKASATDGVWTISEVVAEHNFGDFKMTVDCKCGTTAVTDAAGVTDCEGVVVCTFKGTKKVNDKDATVTVVHRIVPETQDVGNGYVLDPNSAKFDLSVEGFELNDAANYIAVEADVEIKSKDSTDVAPEDKKDQTRGTKKLRGLSALDGTGFFWTEKYSSDKLGGAEDGDVHVIHKKAADKKVVFIFGNNAAANVHWDPEVTLGGANSATTVIVSMFAMLVSVLALLL